MNPFDPKPNSTKVATKWALIYVATSIVITYTFQILNIDPNSNIKYISLLPFIGYMILAQNEYKALIGGYMKYGEAFSAGFKYALFGGLLLAVFTFIYLKWLSPQMLVQSMESQREKMSTQGLSDEQIDKAMMMGEKYGAIFGAFGAAIFSAILGALVSLVTASFTKKDPPPFDPEAEPVATDPTA